MGNSKKKIEYKFGLLGKDISYSFSRGYFSDKFKQENLAHSYENFDLQSLDRFTEIIKNTKNFKGLNVTIPYKEAVMPLLDSIDKRAKKIAAVNTIKITKKGKLKGYNTDYYGFKNTLKPHLKPQHKRALILGTGGASKAVAYALKKLKIKYDYVSRTKKKGVTFEYEDLTNSILESYQIIINCTPIGTHPNIKDCPNIPYKAITDTHILYDLIYNPLETKFLSYAKANGAVAINGLEMLKLQAEKSWEIWNS